MYSMLVASITIKAISLIVVFMSLYSILMFRHFIDYIKKRKENNAVNKSVVFTNHMIFQKIPAIIAFVYVEM